MYLVNIKIKYNLAHGLTYWTHVITNTESNPTCINTLIVLNCKIYQTIILSAI